MGGGWWGGGLVGGAGPTTFTGDALGLLRLIPLRKQKETEVSHSGPGRVGQAQAGPRT